MDKALPKLLTTLVALCAFSLPIIISFKISYNQSLRAESDRTLNIARDILKRSELTADQVDQGFRKLASIKDSNPCSKAKLTVMQENDLASSYVQAYGFIADGKLICSSLLGLHEPIRLGAVDYITTNKVKVRTNASFPFIKDTKFIILERQGYAAILNKELPVDVVTIHQGASKATFNPEFRTLLSAYGHIDKAWITKAGQSWESVFEDNNYLVATARSHRYHVGAIATLPMRYVDQHTWVIARSLLPMGVLGGLFLAAAVVYLARVQKEMKSLLKLALKRREFHLVYQPVVELSTGKWIGVEALIRWRRPNGEMVRPDLFIPVAEESGLIKQITLHVIDLFARDAKDLFKRYPHFHVGINLSAADLETEDIVEKLKDLKIKTNAGDTNMVVEVTERGFLKAEAAQKQIAAIRKHGIEVAIDDFGTGYSSLSYLEKLELDYLKIDKSFVDTVGSDAATSHVVHHIIEMAKSLNLQMIAEGVETELQAEYLRNKGVQFAQGWLFAKPMPFDEMLAKLEQTQAFSSRHQEADQADYPLTALTPAEVH